MVDILVQIKNEAEEWARGKSCLLRAPLLIYFFYVFIKHLGNPDYNSILFGINLGIHELGHIILMPFGMFIHVIGGTVAQCLFPIFVGFGFYKQREFFGLTLCFGWISTNLFNVARYMGDAKAMELPLVSVFGGHTIHDWNYLLGRFGCLNCAAGLSSLVKFGAVISMLVCLYTSSWLLWKMYQTA